MLVLTSLPDEVRDGLRFLGFQLKDLNVDQPGKPPAWVFWHPELFLEVQVAAIKAQLDVTLDHFQNLAPEQLEARFRMCVGRSLWPPVARRATRRRRCRTALRRWAREEWRSAAARERHSVQWACKSL